MLLKKRYEWCYEFAKKWRDSGITALVSPLWPHVAPKAVDVGEQGLMGEYSFIWNVTGYPSGVMPVTDVLPSEQEGYTDTYNDSWTQKMKSNCADSQGLPVCIQVTGYSFEDEQTLGVMAAIDKEVSYKVKVLNNIDVNQYPRF